MTEKNTSGMKALLLCVCVFVRERERELYNCHIV